ncbi:hypothetical protein T439DRAFT_322732 [Meredithblackwellia eburnea MCA 4105]
MPELPDVEAAKEHLSSIAKGNTITKVISQDDTIVYSGVTAADFSSAIQGKKVMDVRRKGKQFYMVLDSAPHPAFHLGMSGFGQVKGSAPPTYKTPRHKADPEDWPPKYNKVVLTFANAAGEVMGEWSLCDARRLGRIKLIEDQVPEQSTMLTSLGRDPLLDMVPLQELSEALQKKTAPIKAVLLDQNGPVCGIGNWMVDEILYQSKIHPAHPSSLLTPEETETLHHHIRDVTVQAVNVGADASKFPAHWIFQYRWSKGKNDSKKFHLPSGEPANIKFITVGGRTSAVIEAVQKLPKDMKKKLTATKSTSVGVKRKTGSKVEIEEVEEVKIEIETETAPPAKRRRRQSGGR